MKVTGEGRRDARLVRYEIDLTRVSNRRMVIARAVFCNDTAATEIYNARDLRVGLFTETGSF